MVLSISKSSIYECNYSIVDNNNCVLTNIFDTIEFVFAKIIIIGVVVTVDHD